MKELIKKYLNSYYTFIQISNASYAIAEIGGSYARSNKVKSELEKIFSISGKELDDVFFEWCKEEKIKKQNEGISNKIFE